MAKRFLSFSKFLSRRMLIINIVMISVLALMVITFAITILKNMTNAYYQSGLFGANESIKRRILIVDKDSLYYHMKELDAGMNAFNPLFENTNEKDNKNVWAYNIVIDRQGNYIYHPNRQRVDKGNFFNDISQSTDELRKQLTTGLATVERGQQVVTVDGEPSYIFYVGFEDANWTNAIIVPRDGLIIPIIITSVILLTIIVLGLMTAYWISRHTIRQATAPLQLLAKSTDEVAKGNFQAPLPELLRNDEISQLRDSFGNMQQSLTKYIDQLQTTTAQKAAFESELNIARDIQLSMVPTVFPKHDKIDIYGSMTPARYVGGDLYDFFIKEDKLYFCIGDVSGKGVPAALLMTVTQNLFRAYSSDKNTPDKIVASINADLSRNNETCMFVTLFVGILDISSHRLLYCNAGHEAPIVIGKTAEPLSINWNVPVGPIGDTPYTMEEVDIAPNTTLLLYTDGLNEATSADKELFGEDRIFDELNRAIQDGQLSPKAVIDRMIQAVHDFVGDAEQSDDLTMLAIRI